MPVEPVDQRREDLARRVAAPDEVAMAVVGHLAVRLVPNVISVLSGLPIAR